MAATEKACEECGNEPATLWAYDQAVCTGCAEVLSTIGACENCGMVDMHADYCSAGQRSAGP